MKTFSFLTILGFALTLLGPGTSWAQIDRKASPEAKALYRRLQEISFSFTRQQKILIGQQYAFSEGRGWRLHNGDRGGFLQSDMEKATGVHPAVLGTDFQSMGHWNKDLLIDQMREVHRRGGVVTLSWHMPTLIDDGKGNNGYDDTTAEVVKHILPGGHAHERFKAVLDKLVAFLHEVKDVPVIFRPWHEHNDSWFWWGQKHCSRNDYIKLWRFTVEHLLSRNVHNLLYAYSPHQIRNDYYERYPGDNYVDVLGVDMYFYNHEHDKKVFGDWPQYEWKKDVIWLMREALKRNKIGAITEFGQEGLEYDRFWTDYFGWPLERAGVQQLTGKFNLPLKGLAYIMLWRNDKSSPKHFYGPIPDHRLNENFKVLMRKGIFQGLGD